MNAESESIANHQPATSLASDATSIPRIARITVDAQGLALIVLSTIAVVFALEWAQSFFIPLLLGILLAYTLNPLVVWLEWIKIYRVIGASLVIVAVVCTLVFGAYSLRGQIQTIIEQLPEAADQLSRNLARMGEGQLGTMQKVQTAANQLEQAASQATGIPATSKKPATRVVIDDPSAFKVGNVLWAGSMGAVGYIVQATMVLFLVFFLLLSGDTYKRKLVRLTGPSLSNKKITVQILTDINHSIQSYMFMLLITNILVALLAWIAFHWIGLDNAGAWAVAAGLLHIIPYLGPGLTAIATGMVAFMQFESFTMALLVSGVWLVIAITVGTFVTTWMTGRIAKMNSAAVFISLLFWGWLWGVWGMLLGIPIVVIVKVISEHIKQLQPVAELLGD
ncbi:MAG: AI-2E family transporter [Candidatus Competibacteraceae bacterium]|nr:MAG: AI-2E family transporter [Candidatus Competibacteraceae bacterium]